MSRMGIRKDDRVKVLSGKDAGKEGKVLRRNVEKNTLIIENINMVTKSVRPSQKDPRGGLIKKEAPVRACKVMLVCPACGKATRIAHAYLDNGDKVRVCKKCGEIIDKI